MEIMIVENAESGHLPLAGSAVGNQIYMEPMEAVTQKEKILVGIAVLSCGDTELHSPWKVDIVMEPYRVLEVSQVNA